MTKAGKVKKPFYKRVWFWVVAVIVAVAIIPTEEEPTTNEPAVEPATQKEETPKEEAKAEPKKEAKPVGIGEALKVGDVTFTVHGKSTADSVGDDYTKQEAQGKYLVLDVSVKNGGKEALTIDSSFFNIKSGESTYSSDTMADIYINDGGAGFFLQEINPGNEARGKIAFDVNDAVINGKDTLLNVQTGFWGTEQGEISIAK